MGIFSKSLVCLLILEAFILSPLEAQSNHEAERAKVYKATEIFIEALINGDISTIRSHIAGSLKNRLKRLLNDNRSYSQFLRKQYANALFLIDDPVINGERASVNVSIEFQQNEKRFFKIKLEKINNGKWMIIEQFVSGVVKMA